MLKFSTRLAAAGAAAALAAASVVGAGTAAAAPGSSPAAPANKSPFRIGFANASEGAIAFPGMLSGAQAAVKYVNSLGGINGHPIVLVTCNVDATPEKNQACGQQFANNKTLNMVMMGFSLQGGPFYEAVKPSGYPVLQSVAAWPSDYNAPNATTYYGGSPAVNIGQAEIANALKPNTIAFITLEGSAGTSSYNYFMARYKGNKANVKRVDIPATATDALPYLVQSGAQSADLLVQTQPNCVPVAKAAKQLHIPGTKVVAIGSCLNSTNLANNPGLFEGWRTPLYVLDPLMGMGQNAALNTFLTQYPRNGGTSPVPTFAPHAWGTVLSLQAALKGTPDSTLTNKKLLQAKIRAFRGPVPLGAPSIKCGSMPSVGNVFCTTWSAKVQIVNGKMVIDKKIPQ